jgi:2-keto-4-pentenoate hydratase/2-oxohepta-3-ene-1,7-dioic acid hydratase in catechol pathway
MKLVRFAYRKKAHYGILKENTIFGLRDNPFTVDLPIKEISVDGRTYELEKVKLLAPCQPSKIVCLGVNYRPHAQEMQHTPPAQPLIFLKPPTAVIGPGDNIIQPRNWKRVDYEGELGVVISKKAKYVSEKEALGFVMGYTCFNDVTERFYQGQDGQWNRGKGFDTFAPFGPWIETELKATDLKLETLLNGQVRQSTRTSELIFGIPQIISFISGVMTLLPGDVIATGTPGGIGEMQAGDIVEIKIEGIGTLKNTVAAPV